MSKAKEATEKLRILTVGDGDLTLSLALSRAFGREQIDLTASTLLPNAVELQRTYSNARDVVEELHQHGVRVCYGVDATKLDETLSDACFDVILFHHPHLGLSTLVDEARHAQRHFCLLAHYFASARERLLPNGRVHVCLCGNQHTTWRLEEAARRQCLTLVSTHPTRAPPVWLSSNLQCLEVQSNYPAPRRYRNGKLGSKHFLGRYGYRHRRTHGDNHHGTQADMNVSGSIHYVFERQTTSRAPTSSVKELSQRNFCCVCGSLFETTRDLERHVMSPATPDQVGEAKVKEATNLPCHKDGGGRKMDNIVSKNSAENLMSSINTIDNEDILFGTVVDSSHNGKRLRGFLRQPDVVGLGWSKKQSENIIKLGRVRVDGHVALDSSRILQTGNIVSVLKEIDRSPQPSTSKACEEPVIVRYITDDQLLVAKKPVGMRSVGTFSSDTLEASISNKLGVGYHCLTKLDTGCAGLSVMAKRESSFPSIEITSVFIALVHGSIPDEFESGVTLPLSRARQWKKPGKRTSGSNGNNKLHESADVTDDVPSLSETAYIKCEEQALLQSEGCLPLSTLHISTTSKAAGICNSICYLLRQRGNPVVNDRLCRQEYLSLPRSIRNAIKKKLCIGCNQIEIIGFGDERTLMSIECPKKLSALHWQQFCAQAT